MVERLAAISDADFGDLVGVLVDVVADGGSVGFLHPMAAAEAEAFWREVAADLPGGHRLLFVARDGGRVVGTVQLALSPRPNGSHRAEVQKLLVHTTARRRGVGEALMAAAEAAARAAGRHLLVLDTAGDPARRLYEKLGYTHAGRIPGFARRPTGDGFDPTDVYYRELDSSGGRP